MSAVDPFHAFTLSQRLKNYSAASGYVYQYIFVGKQGDAHIFEVSADRKNSFRLSVVLRPSVLLACQERLGSPLRWNDEYALAKMSLFDAFDQRENPEAFAEPVIPEAHELLGYMKVLRMVEDDE